MNRYNRSDKPDWVPPRSAKLLDQVRERVRYLHYSLQTEKAYVYWAKAFVLWVARSNGGFRHPREMGQAEVEGFLTMLATEKQVAPATHRQSLNALLFLYRQVLGMELPWMQQIGRPPERKRIPVVLTVKEVQALLGQMVGTEALLAALLYGSGLRLREALGLRVKDVDFHRHAIIVRSGKGDKDRVVMLPRALVPRLQAQLNLVPPGGRKLGLVLGVSLAQAVRGPANRCRAPPPLVRRTAEPATKEGSDAGGHRQTGFRPHAAPLFCHASAAVRHRHSNSARTAGPFGRIDDDDLHACAQGSCRWHGQPTGCAGF
jgi:integrase